MRSRSLLGRTVSGVALLAVAFSGTIADASPAGAAPLRSRVATTPEPRPAVVLRGSGWGHSVGMSQYGAYSQALAGRSYRRILRHYYRGVDIAASPMPRRIRVGLHQAMNFANVEAVTGPVTWKACGPARCASLRARQPRGTTWTVRLRSDGRYTISDGTRLRFRGASGKRLVVDHSGTVVRAYNPNGHRRYYRYGVLEFSRRAVGGRHMILVASLPMESYLRGLGEVPASWGVTPRGLHALKAQAVAARTYALRMHQGNPNSPSCRCAVVATPANQVFVGYSKELDVYGDRWAAAVRETAGEVARYRGTLIATYYSSSHGGRSENIEDSWAYGTTPMPYLRSVDDPWSADPRAGNPYRSWWAAVPNRSFASFVAGDLRRIVRVRVVGRTDGGSPRELRVTGVDRLGRTVVRRRSGAKGIVGIDLRNRFGLRSQQVRRIGFAPYLDDDGSAAEHSIVFVRAAGVMGGVTATRFRPGAPVTRGQMAIYLYRTLNIPTSRRDHFADDNGTAAEGAINALVRAGVIGGAGRRFAPARALRRDVAAVWLSRAVQLRASARNAYADDDGSRHEGAINALAAAGVAVPCGPRRYCPRADLRRDHAAMMLHRAIRQGS